MSVEEALARAEEEVQAYVDELKAKNARQERQLYEVGREYSNYREVVAESDERVTRQLVNLNFVVEAANALCQALPTLDDEVIGTTLSNLARALERLNR